MKLTKELIQEFIPITAEGFREYTRVTDLRLTRAQYKYSVKILEWFKNITNFNSRSFVTADDVWGAIESFKVATDGKEGKEAGQVFRRNFLTVPKQYRTNKAVYKIKTRNSGTPKEIPVEIWGRPRLIEMSEDVWTLYKKTTKKK